MGCHVISYADPGWASCSNQFAAIRLQSNHARRPFQQLRLAIQYGLTYRLYVLYFRVEGIKSRLEVSQATPLAYRIYSMDSLVPAGDRHGTASHRRLGERHPNSSA